MMSMKKETLILDTSLFVNPASAGRFGSSPTAAFRRFLELLEKTKSLEFLMPVSVYQELLHFVEERQIPHSLLILVKRQSPRKHEVKVPGIFIYELVREIRDRTDRGLRLAERHVREALQMPSVPAIPEGERNRVRPDVEIIGRLRDSYRRIMREGLLDSKADADLLLLAYETKGTLVSADQGVLTWAENLGIRILAYEHLLPLLEKHVSAKASAGKKPALYVTP